MNYRRVISIIIVVTALWGCETTSQKNALYPDFMPADTGLRTPWSQSGFLNDPNNFQFAIIGDLNGGYRPRVFKQAIKQINLMQPEFVMSVGDLISGYIRNVSDIEDQWKRFENTIEPLDMRFFFVPGNHDLSNTVMTRAWQERFGPTYYHFIYRDALFLVLNSEDPTKTNISEKQVAYVDKVLRDNPAVRWTFAFLHKPLWIRDVPGWKKIEGMLGGRPHTVLAGHNHTYTKYLRNGQSYIRLATTGGGSYLTGPETGVFDHITWVTMTDGGPVIANLALDGILDENIVTE